MTMAVLPPPDQSFRTRTNARACTLCLHSLGDHEVDGCHADSWAGFTRCRCPGYEVR
jgi:hypothetical protein